MANIKQECEDNADSETDDLFYFESDHIALKGNKDYSELLKTIVILESQKQQAIKDIEKLIELQNVAIQDPISFVEKLKNNEDVGIPYQQIIPEIPYISWSKYGTYVPEEALRLIKEGGFKYQGLPSPRKIKTVSSSTTHNQPWTSEEQKKLEELLVKYPPEAVEMRRFKKIANELGNRTVTQVTSRVQKYFLKLYQAGLPIPGRIPKTAEKKKVHKHQRHNHLLYKPSTFFPETDVPVYMPEDDDDSVLGPETAPSGPQYPSNNSLSASLDPKEEVSLKIDLLRRVKLEKIKTEDLPVAFHVGYKCDLCEEEPLKGIRWHCTTCSQNSIDLCNDCIISQLTTQKCHPLTHQFIPIHNSTDIPSIPNPNLKQEPTHEYQPDQKSPNPVSGNLLSSDTSCQFDMPSSSHLTDIKQEVRSDNENGSSSESESFYESNCNTGYNSEDSRNMNFDEDYVQEMFAQDSGKYNYLDPNFLPELYKN